MFSCIADAENLARSSSLCKPKKKVTKWRKWSMLLIYENVRNNIAREVNLFFLSKWKMETLLFLCTLE